MSAQQSSHHGPISSGHKRHRQPYLFNPLEIGIVGYSNSGKTTLIAGLVERLHTRWRIGYVKHGHRFQLDKPGKDSAVVTAAGAYQACLVGPEAHGLLSPFELDPLLGSRLMIDADVVFVEGFKRSDLHKLLVVSEHQHANGYGDEEPFTHVFAAVGSGDRPVWLDPQIPWLDRDDIDAIAALIVDHFEVRTQRPLHGLILTGGKSTRMGRDKASLDYHGKPQAEHMADLLAAHCEQVVVSTRQGQSAPPGLTALPDTFCDMGPMGGIMTALKSAPKAAWLVVACDLPFLTDETLTTLLAERNPTRAATAFISSSDALPEPLCAVYEPKAIHHLVHFMALGTHCPRKVLIHSPNALITAADPHWLDNVNHPQEFDEARQKLATEKP